MTLEHLLRKRNTTMAFHKQPNYSVKYNNSNLKDHGVMRKDIGMNRSTDLFHTPTIIAGSELDQVTPLPSNNTIILGLHLQQMDNAPLDLSAFRPLALPYNINATPNDLQSQQWISKVLLAHQQEHIPTNIHLPLFTSHALMVIYYRIQHLIPKHMTRSTTINMGIAQYKSILKQYNR